MTDDVSPMTEADGLAMLRDALIGVLAALGRVRARYDEMLEAHPVPEEPAPGTKEREEWWARRNMRESGSAMLAGYTEHYETVLRSETTTRFLRAVRGLQTDLGAKQSTPWWRHILTDRWPCGAELVALDRALRGFGAVRREVTTRLGPPPVLSHAFLAELREAHPVEFTFGQAREVYVRVRRRLEFPEFRGGSGIRDILMRAGADTDLRAGRGYPSTRKDGVWRWDGLVFTLDRPLTRRELDLVYTGQMDRERLDAWWRAMEDRTRLSRDEFLSVWQAIRRYIAEHVADIETTHPELVEMNARMTEQWNR